MGYKAYPVKAFVHRGSYPYMERAVHDSNIPWLRKHEKETDLTLHHYTNGSGLKGIIENRSIWCTSINMLNDPLEFQYGKKLIEDRVDYFIERETDEHIKEALKAIREFPSYIKNTHQIFIASFCEDDNLLSQWRGYAESGVGYNLGFIFNSETEYCLGNNLSDRTQKINLRKVIYRKEEQISLIDDYISNIINGLKQSSFDGKSDIATVSLLTSNLFIDMMLSMKNEKFYEENEWRLLRVVEDLFTQTISKYRLVNNEMIPYLDTYIFNQINGAKVFPLEFIKIGPMLDVEKNKPVISLFIKSEKANDKCITLNSVYIDHAGYTLRK